MPNPYPTKKLIPAVSSRILEVPLEKAGCWGWLGVVGDWVGGWWLGVGVVVVWGVVGDWVVELWGIVWWVIG